MGVGPEGREGERERDGREKLVNSDALAFKPIYQECERNQEGKKMVIRWKLETK